MQPLVKLKGSKPPAPRLLWYPIMCGDKVAGELLAAFELFLVSCLFFAFVNPFSSTSYKCILSKKSCGNSTRAGSQFAIMIFGILFTGFLE